MVEVKYDRCEHGTHVVRGTKCTTLGVRRRCRSCVRDGQYVSTLPTRPSAPTWSDTGLLDDPRVRSVLEMRGVPPSVGVRVQVDAQEGGGLL